jgi:hypothetical protein
MKTMSVIFWIFTILTIAAVSFGWFFWSVAGVGLYDTNFQAFRYTLSEQQAAEIIRTSQRHMMLPLFLLSILGVLWFGFGLFAISKVKTMNSRLQ